MLLLFRESRMSIKPFQPIQLGPIKLDSNVVQGPLAGYSCAPLRALTWRYGCIGFATTEMLSAKALTYRNLEQKRYLWRDPDEGPLCYQLSANEPESLAKATARVSAQGANIIDLNAGCPVGKIRKKNCGSKHLAMPEQLYRCLHAIKSRTDAAVSVKIRVSEPKDDHCNKALIDAIQAAKIDFIIVHGRHWTERYDTPCRFKSIANLVNLTTLPVFANGDVTDTPSLLALFNQTGCAGVMVSRACVGQPWLFKQMYAEIAGEPFTRPSEKTIKALFLEHIDRLIKLENERVAVLEARSLVKYYTQHLSNSDYLITRIHQAASQKEIIRIVNGISNKTFIF